MIGIQFCGKNSKKTQNAFKLETGIDPKCKIVYKWNNKKFLRCKFPRMNNIYVHLWYVIILGWVPKNGGVPYFMYRKGIIFQVGP